ncbi:gifsy-2 prophage protein [Yersinia enterocolitica subsp. palearctica YE-P4]|uniref:Gifsy-2 prophage protein n=3 Tax=Yersinia enterocolitica TaxID=630 RepID=A0A0H3NKT4_YERE1|nr:hypothetical protein YE105_C3326 [Yersinia enterocolitica subsp. palearctica 105.5R(r)]ALG77432.1 DNA breaking-rejoining protein [Yersinia enterocolitica]EHB21238.1 hypothetical protein IOK_08534 [Yersinia enterocolitica subsp. palearctica PhRBD_Ye1]EOR67485.1 gifsy-2 prophage protein [Yersinia enterocolitica subsp. palearctica YE-149]EOR75870.1 gifsy-2 prophage protein [Yersinia enterocolitica subsp. palearctica YE-150]EOR76556.1 gifsy-2 prophage protein [Yersinia enterocolitica subsp. pal
MLQRTEIADGAQLERGDEAEGFLIVTAAADKGLVDIQFVVGQVVFVFSITFSSVSLEVQRLRRNSHSCLVM